MSDQPNPTCATCVYYQPYKGGGVLMQMVPPDDPTKLVHVTPRELRQDLHGLCRIRSQPTFPLRRCDDVCGEHPDFAAWLADRHDTQSRHEPDPERERAEKAECERESMRLDRNGHRDNADTLTLRLDEAKRDVSAARAERDRYKAALAEIATPFHYFDVENLAVIAHKALEAK